MSNNIEQKIKEGKQKAKGDTKSLTLDLTKQDLEFILKALKSASIKLVDLEQAVLTVGKLQELYRSAPIT